MGIFSTAEEKALAKKKREVQEAKHASQSRGIEQLECFPGNLREFCDYKNDDYEIMSGEFVFVDSNENRYSRSKLLRLIDEGCVGLIRYIPGSYTSSYAVNFGCGMPVRKKNQQTGV